MPPPETLRFAPGRLLRRPPTAVVSKPSHHCRQAHQIQKRNRSQNCRKAMTTAALTRPQCLLCHRGRSGRHRPRRKWGQPRSCCKRAAAAGLAAVWSGGCCRAGWPKRGRAGKRRCCHTACYLFGYLTMLRIGCGGFYLISLSCLTETSGSKLPRAAA